MLTRKIGLISVVVFIKACLLHYFLSVSAYGLFLLTSLIPIIGLQFSNYFKRTSDETKKIEIPEKVEPKLFEEIEPPRPEPEPPLPTPQPFPSSADTTWPEPPRGQADVFRSPTWKTLIRNSKDSGANSTLATEVLKKSALLLKRGETRVEDLVNNYESIRYRVDQLQAISKDIGSISSMSHMVSINAAVEAKRAGSHGATFQVVAAQIGDLAKNVKTLTDNVDENLNEIVTSVQDCATTCNFVVELFESIQIELEEFEKIMSQVEKVASHQEIQLGQIETTFNQ